MSNSIFTFSVYEPGRRIVPRGDEEAEEAGVEVGVGLPQQPQQPQQQQPPVDGGGLSTGVWVAIGVVSSTLYFLTRQILT